MKNTMMTLHELIELNKICFGVESPKIRPLFGDLLYLLDSGSSNLSNKFIYTGSERSAFLITYQGDSFLFPFSNYYCLSDNKSLPIIPDSIEVVSFGLFTIDSLLVNSDNEEYEFNGNVGQDSVYLNGVLKVPKNLTINNKGIKPYYPQRSYLIEYDQKINMTI